MNNAVLFTQRSLCSSEGRNESHPIRKSQTQFTVSPAIELRLQFLDGVLQGLVLLLLLLVLPLPLLRRQLQVDRGGVPDGLGTVMKKDKDRKTL